MKIAAIQSDIAWEDPEANFARLRPWIAAAAAAGARLCVLPEMFACGFSMATERIREPPGGPSARFLAEQARHHGLWICGSLPELPAGAYFVMTDIRALGWHDDVAFCRMLPEKVGVAAIPPSSFYEHPAEGRHLVRWAFCKTDDVLDEGLRRLQRLRELAPAT